MVSWCNAFSAIFFFLNFFNFFSGERVAKALLTFLLEDVVHNQALHAFACECIGAVWCGAVGAMLAGSFYANRLKRQLAAQELELKAEAAENLEYKRTQWNNAKQNEKDIAVIYREKFDAQVALTEEAELKVQRLQRRVIRQTESWNMLFIGLLIVVAISAVLLFLYAKTTKELRDEVNKAVRTSNQFWECFWDCKHNGNCPWDCVLISN
jgi:H+/gluconate symporter-like permease